MSDRSGIEWTDATCRCADATWDRWSYGEGYTAGQAAGRRDGWAEGYRAGFGSGAEVAGTRLLLGIEHALRRVAPGRALDLFAGLPDVAGYLDYRRRTAWSDDPCPARCGRCSSCIRAAAVAGNLARHGRPDFPGTARPPVGAHRPARSRVAA